MTIWIMEKSRDNGVTWNILQPYHLYKDHTRALVAAGKMKGYSRWIYRATEFRSVAA